MVLELDPATCEAGSASCLVCDLPAKLTPFRTLPDHLPARRLSTNSPCGACTRSGCGGALRRLGQDAHEMLDVLPALWRMVRSVCKRGLKAAL